MHFVIAHRLEKVKLTHAKNAPKQKDVGGVGLSIISTQTKEDSRMDDGRGGRWNIVAMKLRTKKASTTTAIAPLQTSLTCIMTKIDVKCVLNVLVW